MARLKGRGSALSPDLRRRDVVIVEDVVRQPLDGGTEVKPASRNIWWASCSPHTVPSPAAAESDTVMQCSRRWCRGSSPAGARGSPPGGSTPRCPASGRRRPAQRSEIAGGTLAGCAWSWIASNAVTRSNVRAPSSVATSFTSNARSLDPAPSPPTCQPRRPLPRSRSPRTGCSGTLRHQVDRVPLPQPMSTTSMPSLEPADEPGHERQRHVDECHVERPSARSPPPSASWNVGYAEYGTPPPFRKRVDDLVLDERPSAPRTA